MYKKLLTLAFAMLAFCGAHAQDVDRLSLKAGKVNIPFYFRLDSDVFDPTFRDNTVSLSRIGALSLDETIRIDSVLMVATASPEGTEEYNANLADRRAHAVTNFFKKSFPEFTGKIQESIILHKWSEVAEKVQNDIDVPHRDYVLRVLTDGKGDLTLPRRLKAIDGGVAYQYIEDHYLSKMRSAANAVIYYQPIEQKQEVQIQYVPCPDNEPVYRFVTVDAKYPVVAFRTNLLVPLTNIGVILPLGNRWSIAADWYTPWAFRSFDKNHEWAFQAQGVSAEGRYWFGRNHRNDDSDNREHRLTGHSVGAYVFGGKYDLERNYVGHQGEFYGFGLDYLYALPAWKNRIRWEFEVALGYMHNRSYKYDVFEPGGQLFARTSGRQRLNYFGPTKVSVSLVVPIFKHFNKTVKEVVE